MKFLIEFLRQPTPRAGSETPPYYRKALAASERLLAVYFALCLFQFRWAVRQWVPMAAIMFVVILAAAAAGGRMGVRANLGVYAGVTLAWSAWYIHMFGWNCGIQHFLVPLLVLCFFNVFDPPWLKLAYFLGLFALRMALFRYSLGHAPAFALSQTASIGFQTLNSVTMFIIMAALCILFSSSIQDTERQLRLDKQELQKEAGTDPLTQLPNRRAMLDEIDLYLKASPREVYSVAIADIDFFKKVNDTYGHSCGDYTLRRLADKFREAAGADCKVCRWGGEEFCFFMPGKNLDQAGRAMAELCGGVGKMKLSFDGHDFSITVTIGVEENDFHSPIDAILEGADRKLYIGKQSGRNQVVI